MDLASNHNILEAMLDRATNPTQENVDEVAVQIFCVTIRNDPTVIDKATDLLVSKIRSSNVAEALRTVSLLEQSMGKCGTEFQDEISKFRFLNRLTRLVSKEHDGRKTPQQVRDRILDCLLLWTTEYPERGKIREVYERLRVEGHNSSSVIAPVKKDDIMGVDEVKFRKLIQSGNAEDLKRANLLIQARVQQEVRRAELLRRHKTQLEEVRNTVLLLSQMLDSFEQNKDSEESLDLIKELHESCENYLPVMERLPDLIDNTNEDLIAESREVNDRLKKVLQRYQIEFKPHKLTNNGLPQSGSTQPNLSTTDLLSDLFTQSPRSPSNKPVENLSVLDELTDIFSNEATPPIQPNTYSNLDLLEPVSVFTNKKQQPEKETLPHVAEESKFETNRLKDIDLLSEELLRENLKSTLRVGSFKKEPEKVSLNTLAKGKTTFDSSKPEPATPQAKQSCHQLDTISDRDEPILLIGNDQLDSVPLEGKSKEIDVIEDSQPEKSDLPVIHLADIDIGLDDVSPTSERIILDDDIKITLNFTSNRPSPNVSVVVISVVNQSKLAVSDFQFDASVPKPNKVRLLPATGDSMPVNKPFRLPSPIHQIMLLLHPTKADIDVTCIVGYKLGDDPDPIKESIVAKSISFME